MVICTCKEQRDTEQKSEVEKMKVHAVIINKGIRKEFKYNSVKMMKDDIKEHFRHATVVRYSKVTMNDEYSEPKYLIGTPQDEMNFNEEMKKPVGYKTITDNT